MHNCTSALVYHPPALLLANLAGIKRLDLGLNARSR
jgi:hypothetical protein